MLKITIFFSNWVTWGGEINKTIDWTKLKHSTTTNNKNVHKLKQRSQNNKNIFKKDILLEAALTILHLALVLDDPVQIGIFLNLHAELANNLMFVTLQSVVMEINLLSQIQLFGYHSWTI
jgi:hypothetical protein